LPAETPRLSLPAALSAWLASSAIFAWMAWPTYWSVVDDSYISARYAENFVAGHGLVYNAGEPPIEGYTDLLWVLMVAACRMAGSSAVSASVGLGTLFGVLAIGATIALASALTDRHRLAFIPGVMLALDPRLAVSATNGLESSQFVAFVSGATAAVLVAEGRGRWLAAALAAIVPLVRPEGLAVALALAGYDVVRRREAIREPRTWIVAIAVVGAVFGLELWRYGTYGDWVPNTWHAKSNIPILKTFSLNQAYFAPHQLVFAWMAIATAVGTVAAPSLRTLLVTCLALGLTAIPMTVVEWMPGLRLYIAPLALATALSLTPVRWFERRFKHGDLAWGAALLLIAGGISWNDTKKVRAYDGHHTVQPGNHAQLAAEHLATHLPKGSWVATRDAGVVAYYVGIDLKVAELHNRALTLPHVNGRDLEWRKYTPKNPDAIVTTIRSATQTDLIYGSDKGVLEGVSEPYDYLGRVNQHYRRHYDVYVRGAHAVPPLDASIVASFAGPKAGEKLSKGGKTRPQVLEEVEEALDAAGAP